jgi:hypothetical protein
VLTAVTIGISAPGLVGFLGAGLVAERTGSTVGSFLLVTVATTAGALVLLPGLLAARRRGEPVPAGDQDRTAGLIDRE